ncbi:g6509 [Coccomyxa elongata]
MSESGIESEDYRKFIEEDSGNVSSDGFFSIQVLSKALQVFGLSCINLDNPEVVQSAVQPELEEAFICNLREHWFCLRRVSGDWWNFNSLLPAPQPLSQFYLSAYLASLREQGYSIFVVQGALPPVTHDSAPASHDGPGQWFTPEQARINTKDSSEARQSGYLKAAYHGAMAQATQEGKMVTLRPQQDYRSRSRSQSWDDDDDLAKAIAASMEGQNHAQMPPASASTSVVSEPAISSPTARVEPPPPSDPGEEPDAGGPGVIELAIRLPNGTRLMRRFNNSQPVDDVLNFVRYSCPEVGPSPVLCAQMPRRSLHDIRQKLRDAGLANRDALTVQASS